MERRRALHRPQECVLPGAPPDHPAPPGGPKTLGRPLLAASAPGGLHPLPYLLRCGKGASALE
eukprot:3883605-Prorocentrum_lima.AAC.1